MSVAYLVSTRSTCLRRSVGAVIVRDKHILSTGHCGAPRGMSHCDEVGCLREKLRIPSGKRQELCRGVHAEQNAIIQAALHGVSTLNGTIYITYQPCITCAKMIINAGITRVIYGCTYADELGIGMLEEAGVEFELQDLSRRRGGYD